MKQIILYGTLSIFLGASIFFLTNKNSSNTQSNEIFGTWGNKHVIVFGIDGMRSDAFREAVKPNIDNLINTGTVTYDAYAGGDLTTSTQQATSSGPGWSSILTGVWINKHGVSDNSFSGHDFTNYPHFFSRLYDINNNANLASIVNWAPIDASIVGNSANNTNFFRSTHVSDIDVTNAAVTHLTNADPDVLFLHFDDLDHDGHATGFSTTNNAYMAQITDIDSQIGQVITAVESRPNFVSEDWLYIVVTDHGGLGTSHGGQSYDERRIALVVSGGSAVNQEVFPGPGHNSVPATVAQHLGVNIDPNWDWDGTSFGFTSSNTTLETNLMGCYNLDNNTSDNSLEGNNGVANGNPIYTSGKVGMAMQFDGSDDYVSLGNPSNLNFGTSTDFSLSLWVKNLNGGSDIDGVIIGNKDWDNGAFTGWVTADGATNPNSWQWNIGDNSNREDYEGASGGIGNNDNLWHHIAISHDRDDFAVMYLDGALVSSVNCTSIGNIDSGLPTVIGADATLNDYFLDGQIDDVSIWNRRLSETEISTIINNANSGTSICESTLSVTNPEISKVKIYPNPSSDLIYYNSDINFSEVIIYDLNAKEIYRSSYSRSSNFIDISSFSEGSYFIQFKSDTIKNTLTFVKSNH